MYYYIYYYTYYYIYLLSSAAPTASTGGTRHFTTIFTTLYISYCRTMYLLLSIRPLARLLRLRVGGAPDILLVYLLLYIFNTLGCCDHEYGGHHTFGLNPCCQLVNLYYMPLAKHATDLQQRCTREQLQQSCNTRQAALLSMQPELQQSCNREQLQQSCHTL